MFNYKVTYLTFALKISNKIYIFTLQFESDISLYM